MQVDNEYSSTTNNNSLYNDNYHLGVLSTLLLSSQDHRYTTFFEAQELLKRILHSCFDESQLQPQPLTPSIIEETFELLTAHLLEILKPAQNAQEQVDILKVEYINREMGRFSTNVYTLEQQIKWTMTEKDAALIEYKQQHLEHSANKMQEIIIQFSPNLDIRNKFLLTLKQIVTSNVFVFGLSALRIG
eukprot:TRINITY_DN387_c0_g5_i1.p1 TRINITY_DN387_c0_g5~~TRINITY_DN387_c0_g5_i1.p1  ORF type:complete len:189 (-),score=44.71 TRINITY_DN387_c0_g5_i1:155-721(-)